MMSARSIFAIVCSFLALTAFSCAKGSTGGAGGGGGEGGDDWGGQGPGPGSSNSSSGSGTGGTGGVGGGGTGGSGAGGGSSACDNKGVCGDCADCATTTGPCVSAYDTCNTNTSCVNLAVCLSDCADGDDVCVQGCAETYSAGVDDFIAYQDCVVCVGCPFDCDAAGNGC
jgi:hypothetical protein